MSGGLSVRELRASYGEFGLVEQPAIDMLTSLGWSHKNLYPNPGTPR